MEGLVPGGLRSGFRKRQSSSLAGTVLAARQGVCRPDPRKNVTGLRVLLQNVQGGGTQNAQGPVLSVQHFFKLSSLLSGQGHTGLVLTAWGLLPSRPPPTPQTEVPVKPSLTTPLPVPHQGQATCRVACHRYLPSTSLGFVSSSVAPHVLVPLL